MSDEKKVLQEEEVAGVGGGAQVPEGFKPYNDKYFPVSCPYCHCRDTLCRRGLTFSHVMDEWMCSDCGRHFGYYDLDDYGGSNDW